jgi:hypothetical protein
MGRYILAVLDVLAGRVPDPESHSHVRQLVADEDHWSAGHVVFNEIRRRYLSAAHHKDDLRAAQYAFEESCCQAVYNSTEPFDSCSPFFVVPQAMGLAALLRVSPEDISNVFKAAG